MLKIHAVDESLPLAKLALYGFQHVLAMYVGAVAVPIIVAREIGLSERDLIKLINAATHAGWLFPRRDNPDSFIVTGKTQ